MSPSPHAPRIASVAGAVVVVRPIAMSTMEPTTGPQYGVSASNVEARRNPTVIDVNAPATTRLVPNRSANRPAIGAATAIVVGCVAITPAGGYISPGWAMLLGGLAAFTGLIHLPALLEAVRQHFPGSLGDKNVAAATAAYDLVLSLRPTTAGEHTKESAGAHSA